MNVQQISLILLASFTISESQAPCGDPLAYKNQRVDHERSAPIWWSDSGSRNVSNTDCMRMCCEREDCTTLTFSGFLTSRSGQCLLFTCGTNCVLVEDNNPEGILTITLNRSGRETSAPTQNGNNNNNNNQSTTNIPVKEGGVVVKRLFASCSTPIGIAIFVAVFCCAVNVGLFISLMWKHRSSRGNYDASSGRTVTAANPLPSTSVVNTGGGGGQQALVAHQKRAQQALHAYNNIGLASATGDLDPDDIQLETHELPVHVNIQFDPKLIQ